MIPLALSAEIRTTLLSYLTTTFNFADKDLETALVDFLEDEETGLFKGPYINLRLPFCSEPAAPVLEIMPPFAPYVHQQRSFKRLTSRAEHVPEPTLITTGTGSGKTECFLYPILDHCHAHRDKPGIKAIILYPMNALASDQAGRLAQAIWQDERLRGNVTAGIYIGGEKQTAATGMTADGIIEDRHALRQTPPDILLTNYKMLDFLLLRPEDKPLWQNNAPDTLRYLVLDELHTYDGAQGSDVACLIRRLRSRLAAPQELLCPVGTSATIGEGTAESRTALTAFASQIFGVAFDAEAVIVEDRLSVAAFLPEPPTRESIPPVSAELEPEAGEAIDSYIARQSTLWFGQALADAALATALREHRFLRDLLQVTGTQIVAVRDAAEKLAVESRQLHSFLALIAAARTADNNGKLRPFLSLQIQLWVREMSRMMHAVSAMPAFFWRDDVPVHDRRRGLPLVVCRDCGHAAWLAVLREGDDILTDNHQKIYQHYFARSRHSIYLSRTTNADRLLHDRLCPRCLRLSHEESCHVCDTDTLPVQLDRTRSKPRSGQPRDLHRCPVCNTDDAFTIVGSQAASLLSVSISQLFTSPLNTDKKLLAFTDSVQDASHRAGFFGARTYRFGLRTAFQAVLQAQPADASVRLDQFTATVLRHWRAQWATAVPDGAATAPQKLAAAFMPADLREQRAYRHFLSSPPGPLSAVVADILQQRVSWEVTMEYGYNARIGRSLERVGSSVATLDPPALTGAIADATLLLRNEIGLLSALAESDVRHFVVGLLERTRQRGGVMHPLLAHYVDENGNAYRLNKRINPLLSPFSPNARLPRFLTTRGGSGPFDVFVTSGSTDTWFVDWARRTLAPELGFADINELYRLLMDLLVRAGLLASATSGRATVYGLRPDKLWLSASAAILVCDTCGQQQTAAVETMGDRIGQPCLRFRCRGHLHRDPNPGHDYYRALYARGQVERIFAQEHTGLLERDTREEIETAFKTQSRADAPNLLVATPTLEMGIDVGDLSATMACAVPPTTANYLQRIGRAGRATGNALILTLANAKPHDLYFHAEPLAMIAGSVMPPGCFLDAPRMLARQFLAFTLDNWVVSSSDADRLPRTVKDMLARYQRGEFPTNWLTYYADVQDALVSRFSAIFAKHVSAENQQALRDYAAQMPYSVMAAVNEAVDERDILRRERTAIKRQRDKIEADPQEYADPGSQIKALNQEMKVILAQIKELEDKYILNFFTDAGLLPNYAFPETGVKLNVIMTGISAGDEDDPNAKNYVTHEYMRAAPTAIRELAPFNTFYAQGHKMRVTHVNVSGKDNQIEQWQFCPRCSHVALVQSSQYQSACPRCGSPLWKDSGQQHPMTLLRQVAAWTDHQQSLTVDDADDRDKERYEVGQYFDIPEHDGDASVPHANLIAQPLFGIEYHNAVTLREINFGLSDQLGAKLQIADEERPQDGYKICPSCGVVVDSRAAAEEKPRHTRQCLARSRTGRIDWQQLYLYRELHSEALRILLPVSTFLVEEKLATFQAALGLGIRRKFQGRADHLNITPHTEVGHDGTRRRYLIIYDSVPGGTSFLRDLAQPEQFRDVLQRAHDVVTTCSCRHDAAKDACYRCLYAYDTQYSLAHISRRLAAEMLGEILNRWDDMQPVFSLSDVVIDSLIESELEQKLVDALAQHVSNWSQTTVAGHTAWEFAVNDHRWLLQPQVTLGVADGVAVPSRADFVLWPQGPLATTALPVAVFTDGKAYHVQPNHAQARIARDLHQRQALVDSGEFVVWSLTWDDVEEFATQAAFPLQLLERSQAHVLGKLPQTLAAHLDRDLVKRNGVMSLLAYLNQPDKQAWREFAMLLALAWLRPPRPPQVAGELSAKHAALLSEMAIPDLSMPETVDGTVLYAVRQQKHLHRLLSVEQAVMQAPKPGDFRVTLRLDDAQERRSVESFAAEWRLFWLLFNLMQFLPHFASVTSESIRSEQA